MSIIGVIPARWASTRFPGKVLADLNGKPMIRHVWERASQADSLDQVIIACDDEKVQQACAQFGATAVMTAPDHASGTDRIVEAVQDIGADIVVNIQGDEPLISPNVIDLVAGILIEDKHCSAGTVVKRLSSEDDLVDPNIVKAVIDCHGYALYFSRHPIPFNREGKDFIDLVFYKHLGLYAYRRDFLMAFKQLPYSTLEQTEKLEQLRVLEAGHRIKTAVTDYDALSVDTPEDLHRVSQLLSGDEYGKNG